MKPQILRGLRFLFCRVVACDPTGVPGVAAWPSAPSGAIHTSGAWSRYGGYRTKRVGFMVTFRLVGAEKSVLKLVGANLKDGQNVLVL